MTHNSTILANTILSQIGRHIGGTLSCIGASNYVSIPETLEHLGGVSFKIRPNPKMKLAGKVTVTLSFDDTYRVLIETCRHKVMLDQKNVYCEDLGGPEGIIERTTG
jgi:hypothetical protein